MAALTKARQTPQKLDGTFVTLVDGGVKTSTTLFVGGIVCADSTGYFVPASATTGLVAVGVLTSGQPFGIPGVSVTNSGASGALVVNVAPGVYKFDIDGSDPVTIANNMTTVYLTDDHTICATATGKSAAGQMVGIDDATSPTGAGVWVSIGASVA